MEKETANLRISTNNRNMSKSTISAPLNMNIVSNTLLNNIGSSATQASRAQINFVAGATSSASTSSASSAMATPSLRSTQPLNQQGVRLNPMINPVASSYHTHNGLTNTSTPAPSSSSAMNRVILNTNISRSVPGPLNLISANSNQPQKRTQSRGSASNYRKMTHKQHIMEITDTYVGSDEQIPRYSRLLITDEDGNLAIRDSSITLPEAVERLFIEILSNSSDNVDASRKAGIDAGAIEVNVTNTTVSVRNGGIPIPIELHADENIYVPELIFGNLLTSSNYDKEVDRTGCGRNGYGAKLVNIFSKLFSLKIGDSVRGLEYHQYWTDNMDVRHEPVITQYAGESYVEITYELDFQRFGYQQYPEEALALFARHAADTALMMKTPVYFNQTLLNYSNVRNYAKLLFGKDEKNIVVLTTYDPSVQLDKKGKPLEENTLLPQTELCIVDTPDNALVISSVNGMMTHEGGVHVESAYKSIVGSIIKTINDSVNKGKEVGKNNKKLPKLTLGDLKPHLSFILVCHLPNPKFNAQTKTMLKSPVPKFEIPEKDIKRMLRWDFVARLYATLEAKQDQALAKSDGKKRRHINVTKAEDANLAGGPRSQECTLYVTEGKSAMGYAVNAISIVPDGRNIFGVYPMKGKPLNVMNATPMKLAENQEIKDLKEMLGLQEGVDYTVEANFKKLRYGYFVILADSDDDGKHIVGLILNIFHCRYPSLLARGYVMFLRTPILRAFFNKQSVKFYTASEYERWKVETPNWDKWKCKYYKGLATSTEKDIKEDFESPKIVMCFYDPSAPNSMQLAFDSTLADSRKRWIAEYQDIHNAGDVQMQPISDFINTEFVLYSIANVARSIPRFMDGLKSSQRKAIWGAFKKWKRKVGKEAEEFKVARFANYVAEQTDYHHGEQCMCDTIVNMAQDFTGSNNMPCFIQDGQFGTRNLGGDDAGNPRYIYTRPNWWLPLVFRKEDEPLLNLLTGDDPDKHIEPATLLPIFPLSLVNGSNGIGTAWSTFIPNHNPVDIITGIRSLLAGEGVPEILPWYRGFRGTIKVVIKGQRQAVPLAIREGSELDYSSSSMTSSIRVCASGTEDGMGSGGQPKKVVGRGNIVLLDQSEHSVGGSFEDSSEEDTLDFDPSDPLGPDDEFVETGKVSIVVEGRFQIVGDKVIVTELPVGRTMHAYNLWLQKLLDSKEITDFTNTSTASHPLFTIIGFSNPSLKNLRLIRSFGMTNMVMLNDDDRPVKYDSLREILTTFVERRLPYYQMRKDQMISEIDVKINECSDKIRFIDAILTKQLKYKRRSKNDIYVDMDNLGIPRKLLSTTSFSSLSEEDIQKLEDEISSFRQRREQIESTTPQEFWISDLNEFETAYNKQYRAELAMPDDSEAVQVVVNNRKKKGKSGGVKSRVGSGLVGTNTKSKGKKKASSQGPEWQDYPEANIGSGIGTKIRDVGGITLNKTSEESQGLGNRSFSLNVRPGANVRDIGVLGYETPVTRTNHLLKIVS